MTTAKDFATVAARFALTGRTLHRCECLGRSTYYVQQFGQTRAFTTWVDVTAFLSELEATE